MELEIMKGVASEIFQINAENTQLSLEKKDELDQDLGQVVFNGKNYSTNILQLKPTQKSSEEISAIRECGQEREKIVKFVFNASFNNSVIDKFGKSNKPQKLTSKKDLPNQIENTEDITKSENLNDKKIPRCLEAIQKEKVDFGAYDKKRLQNSKKQHENQAGLNLPPLSIKKPDEKSLQKKFGDNVELPEINQEMKVDKDEQNATNEKLKQGDDNIKNCDNNVNEISAENGPKVKMSKVKSLLKQGKKCNICEENIEMTKYSSHIKSCFYLCSKFLTNRLTKIENEYQCNLCSAKSTVKKDIYRHIRENHNLAADQKTDVGAKEKVIFYLCKFCNEMINKNDFVEHIKKNHYGSVEKIQNNVTIKRNQRTELVKIDNSNNQNLVEKDSEIETPTQKKSKDNINVIDPLDNLGDPQKEPIEQSNELEISNDVVDSSEIGLDMTVEEVNHMHGIVENKINNNKQIVDTTIDQQIEQSINVEGENQKHEFFENRIDEEIIETIDVGNYQQIDQAGQSLMHIQDQLFKAQAIKCDMCSYFCSDLYSMEQHFTNVHIEKSQSISSETEQNTVIAIEDVTEDQVLMMSDDHNSDEVTELDPLDISSPTAIENDDQMQDLEVQNSYIQGEYLVQVQKGLTHMQIDQLIKNIQDQRFRAQAMKCDMCSYICSDLDSMEQHLKNVHMEKSQSETNDLMQDQTTPAHVQESNVQKDHSQQGFQQGCIKIMVMPKDKCNFCNKMFKKGEFVKHVKENHKRNDVLNEFVEQQRKG